MAKKCEKTKELYSPRTCVDLRPTQTLLSLAPHASRALPRLARSKNKSLRLCHLPRSRGRLFVECLTFYYLLLWEGFLITTLKPPAKPREVARRAGGCQKYELPIPTVPTGHLPRPAREAF